ncbi:MAG: hypothetical protein QOJ07_1005 [Thermoleophilaceae bacterium]|nr:hypothetical protein [Thermoleophilaceae bacterium]
MPIAPTEPTAAGSILEEHLTSPSLLLALLGQDAMRRLRAALDAHDLKPRQFQLLAMLRDHGPLGQGELGQTMGVDPSILVTFLNPLEARGLVTRRRDALDRRRHVVGLTAAGGRHLVSAARAQRAAEDDLFAGIDADQRQQLRTLLVALQGNSAGAPCEAGDGEDPA